jgi:methanethiol S-methyltransferase
VTARAFVWAGGAIFVASLAFCVWWFLFVLGATPVSAAGVRPLAFDALLCLAFGAHHSVLARDSVKRRLAATIPAELVRSVYVWVASLLLMVVCAFWRPIGGVLFDVRGVGGLALAAVQLGGVGLIARAVATIDPLALAGIRAASRVASLQVGGPYRFVRHPLHLGWMMATFGARHMTGDRFAFAVFTALYIVAAVPFEERSLRRSFGDDYTRYQRRVRWRIIPFIY